MELTVEEKKHVAKMQKIASSWPRSLWLFSANGVLHVMKKVNDEKAMTPNGCFDADHTVATIYGIDNDGGDW